MSLAGFGQQERILPFRQTSAGWAILDVHYSAVPGYDFAAASRGLSRQAIRTELEIDFLASTDKAVYPEFSQIHVSKDPLPYYKDRMLVVGLDVPGTPAACILQINPFDQLCALRTLSPPEDEAISYYDFFEAMAEVLYREFAEPYGRELSELAVKFYGDPAGNAPIPKPGQAPKEARSCFDILRSGIRVATGLDERGEPVLVERPGWGWHVTPGEVSEVKRIAAVGARLSVLLRGGIPALLVDPSCRTLIEGLSGAYCYPELSNGRGYEPHPGKGFHSHTCNALEYPCTRLFALKSKDDRDRTPRREQRSRSASRVVRG